MKHTLKLVRSGLDLYDFQGSNVSVLSQYSPEALDKDKLFVKDNLVINPHGSNTASFYDNLNTLFRALEDADFNLDRAQRKMTYTPIFLQFRHANGNYVVQTEVFGGARGKIENYVNGALRSNLVNAMPLELRHRPYWEETSAQTLATDSSCSNNGGYVEVSGVRGDIPSPLKFTIRAGVANQDRVIIAAKYLGTVANFVNKYEAESYTEKHSSVTSLTDSDLSGGAGMKFTPATTSEVSLIKWNITSNVSDQLGTYRVFVRCRDKAATLNTKIRVRSGIYTSSGYQWGEYGDYAKYADGTVTAGGSNGSSGGTTEIALVDCGIISLPSIDTNGVAPSTLAIELRGTANAQNGTSTYQFDIDCIYLMPCFELPCNTGLTAVQFPYNLGTNAEPDAVIDSNDRTAAAYLTTSGVLQYPSQDVRGSHLKIWNNKTVRFYILTQRSSNLRHTRNSTNTVSITATPRYQFSRGT